MVQFCTLKTRSMPSKATASEALSLHIRLDELGATGRQGAGLVAGRVAGDGPHLPATLEQLACDRAAYVPGCAKYQHFLVLIHVHSSI
jgi:hypothetical protein